MTSKQMCSIKFKLGFAGGIYFCGLYWHGWGFLAVPEETC